ncbi:hypothetical protein ACLSZP_01340 [Avibacterium avium]|uniref:hypothetical protein n=1 Tax=Avibacterium avium TaxID=751 RepID=UPI003BF8877F
MQDVQKTSQATFQEQVLATFEYSLTEEQRFLQDVLTGKIKLIPHDDVIEKLEYVLENGLN